MRRYGDEPIENTSQAQTPKDHTSDATVKVPCPTDSGAIRVLCEGILRPGAPTALAGRAQKEKQKQEQKQKQKQKLKQNKAQANAVGKRAARGAGGKQHSGGIQKMKQKMQKTRD